MAAETKPASDIRRKRILIGIAVAILGLYAVAGLRQAGTASEQFRAAESDVEQMRRKLAEITRLRRQPTVAALQLEPPAAISQRVSAALEAAGIADASLLDVEPGQPTRIDRSDFKLRETTIRLSSVGLPEVLRFCRALRDDETGSVVRDLTLNTPRSSGVDGTEKWDVELVLTQVIFSPTSA